MPPDSKGRTTVSLEEPAFVVSQVDTKSGLGGITDGGLNTSISCDFISTWDTAQAGSASDTVVLPLLSGGVYSGTIDWGDGNSDALSYANRTHVYASSGTYTITISGSDIQGFQFANAGDKAKITDISNWGNLTLTTDRCFFGCSNLQVSATDAPNITTTSFFRMFANCTSIGAADFTKFDVGGVQSFSACFESSNFNGDLNTWDMSSATTIYRMFRTNAAFNKPLNLWQLSSCTAANETFQGASSFDQDISNWDIDQINNFTNFMSGVTLSTTNYDALLVGWEATLQATWAGGTGYPYTININFGGSKYTGGGAADAARASLISNFGWTITDGGAV